MMADVLLDVIPDDFTSLQRWCICVCYNLLPVADRFLVVSHSGLHEDNCLFAMHYTRGVYIGGSTRHLAPGI